MDLDSTHTSPVIVRPTGSDILNVSVAVEENGGEGGLRSMVRFVSKILPIAYEFGPDFVLITDHAGDYTSAASKIAEIGRASCRERV